jgi:hypothetical protein
MASLTHLTHDAKAKFLAKLATGASITASAKAAGVHRQTYYDWRDSDPEFATEADHAIEAGTDVLEDSALKQAKTGNTSLMVLLLKSRRPDKYKDRTENQLTGPNGAPLTITLAERPDGPA